MNCKQVQKYASEYLDAKLPKSMLDLIEAHLSECEICRKYIAELRIILTKVSGLKTQAIAFDGWQNIKNQINQIENIPKGNSFHWRFPVGFAMVIILLIAVIISQPKTGIKKSIISKPQINPYYAAHVAFLQSNPLSGSEVFIIQSSNKAELGVNNKKR